MTLTHQHALLLIILYARCVSTLMKYVDIKELLFVLLQVIKELCTAGLTGVIKTLLFSVLLKINEKYVQTFEALTDILASKDTCWGSGISVNGTAMSQSA